MDSDGRENATGTLFWVGLCMLGGGLILWILMSLSFVANYRRTAPPSPVGQYVGLGACAIGLLLIIGSWVYGLTQERKARTGTGIARTESGCRIISRYAFNKRNEHLTEEWQFEQYADEGIRYFVRLQFASGRSLETECARETWEWCGDGMVGTATIDHKWLLRFAPQIPGQPHG